MTTYSVLNGVISISFSFIPDSDIRSLMKANGFRWSPVDKLWQASYSSDRENIAKKIVSSDPEIDLIQQADASESISVLDEAISNSLKGDNPEGDVKRLVFEQLMSNPDSVIELINHYKEETKSIESEKSQYEEAKLALTEIITRKKFVTSKRSALEKIVASYLTENNIEKQKCKDYSLVLSNVKSFSLSKEYAEALIARLELPAWLNVEISLNKEVLEQMEAIPEGVDVVEHRKFKLQKNLNETSNETLDYFKKGMTIQGISQLRGLQWMTVYKHLAGAVSKGELNLLDYVDSETLEAIKEYHEYNPTASTIQEYVNAFSGQIPYDIMALSLKFLKIK